MKLRAESVPAPAAISPAARASQVINSLTPRLFTQWPAEGGGNVVFSPYSIAAALAMTYPGSEGETRSQMRDALGFPENPQELATGFHALDAALFAPHAADDESDASFHRANRLYAQQGYPFRESFLSLIKEQFDAPVALVDFLKNWESARKEINQWVEAQTAGRITDLLPGGSLDSETRMVLVNALYFKAPWREEFPASRTAPRPFQLADGTEISVPTMALTERIGFTELEQGRMIVLGYRGVPVQFVAILPAAHATPESLLTEETFRVAQNIPFRKVALELPKFRLAPPTVNLADLLSTMGMPSAFDRPRGSANFDQMAPRSADEYLLISGVYHKAFVEVDEKGTEAAAATAVAMIRATMIDVEEPVEVKFDRPFYFAIQHQPTGAVLFVGKVADPR